MDSQIEDSTQKCINMTRKSLFDTIKESHRTKFEEKFDYLEAHLFNVTKCPEKKQKDLKHHLSHFKSQFKNRWAAARNTEAVFVKKNEEWLTSFIRIPTFVPMKSGRPIKSFQQSSERTKRRKTEDLRTERTSDELSFAAQMSLRKSGQVVAANVIRDITNTTPKGAKKYSIAINKPQKHKQLSPTNALSIFVEAELTRRQYDIIRQADKSKYPCYSVLQKAKAECYPPRESYRVTSTCAELELQPLLDRTTERLLISLSDVLERFTVREKENHHLISKWGCDGSKQSQYKQKFEDDCESDANIFQSSFAYLQLLSEIDGKKKVVWQNPTSSSPRYCRPIRIRFVHETTDITNQEVTYIENQIKALQRTVIQTNSGAAIVQHKLLFTMIDGKVCNAVTGTKYTQRCYICGATSKQFNDLDAMSAIDINPQNVRFGLSILHARIRFFESVLHLSYKLTMKEWQVKKNSANQKLLEERKKSIQQAFKEEMGLLVDFPKAGFGNTNDGNTSRRFFSDIDKAAAITGIDAGLLYRYKVILETISCGLNIDAEKFSKYALDTAKLYVKLYSWYPMPPTVHKVLVHGAVVISSAILPVGQLSEEAAEARNKHFRQYRLGFSRKFTREACNLDIINRLLLRSDPLLTSLRPCPKKKTKPFSKETVEMLLPAEIPHSSELNALTKGSNRKEEQENIECSDTEQE